MMITAAFEAPTVVAGLNDIAMVGQAVEQRGGHLGIAEHAGPFAEGEVGGDNDRGAFVKPANKVEQELTAGLSEREIAEFVEDKKSMRVRCSASRPWRPLRVSISSRLTRSTTL